MSDSSVFIFRGMDVVVFRSLMTLDLILKEAVFILFWNKWLGN